jgi:glycosyltransferase involved in cell wall biosynthesis
MLRSKGKVLLVGPLPPIVGGITTFITNLKDSRLTEQFTLLTFGTERPTLNLFREVYDYSIVAFIGSNLLLRSIICTTSHILSYPFFLIRNNIHIVHINTASYWSFWENAVYVILSRMLLKKTILHIHGGFFEEFYEGSSYFSKFLIRAILTLSDVTIVLSPSWKQFFAKLMPERKISVLPNFVELNADASFNIRNRPSSSETDVINVLFIGGAGAKGKGLFDVVRAIPILRNQLENIYFFLVACSGVEGLETELCEKGITSNIKILGYLYGDELSKIYSESDIFILPSYAEGLPITMLEAMATGLPVVATSVGAIPDVIQNGVNGFLIKAGDFNELSEKILILSRNPSLRREMAKNNIELIRNLYEKSVVLKDLQNEYNRLLGRSNPD